MNLIVKKVACNYDQRDYMSHALYSTFNILFKKKKKNMRSFVNHGRDALHLSKGAYYTISAELFT
jgi:hypothetical protein